MPRKNVTPTVKIHIRDNQRRCRARQKELVQDLQRRLQDYERRGVQASIHMQHAARAVSEENRRLRSLLARYGVSGDEIEQHLRHDGEDRDDQHGQVQSADLHRSSYNVSSRPSPTNKDQQHAWRRASPHASPESPRSPAHTGAVSPTSTQDSPRSAAIRSDRSVGLLGQHEWDAMDFDKGLSFGYENDGPATESGCESELHLQTDVHLHTANVSRTAASSMETPCELAAAIVADVQGHGDQTLVYPALGCSVTNRCLVKNVKILDLIDKNI
ncbi:hypothetical protein HMPREF1624_02954 [Sporothrix schenckii ATCC 58251]|uniref:BZIP domain-containing protein n=1 Tax=Sporothrix schenckii (strain ATCC 58251 / de Perez 2211183) TaxID=1391915 RepID=U7Q3V0_SPOS1|nr:hypothetical protein HMPREF1624_02954 [Sporothrix schenckii ATCC 58251]